MEIIQRGNPSIMKSIAQKSKQVSESRGMFTPDKTPIEVPNIIEGGAYSSIMKKKKDSSCIHGVDMPLSSKDGVSNSQQSSSVSRENLIVSEKCLIGRLLESVETLEYNKEYFNATSSLFTLYSMGKLSESVLSSISREDLREVKAIIREFKDTLDSF